MRSITIASINCKKKNPLKLARIEIKKKEKEEYSALNNKTEVHRLNKHPETIWIGLFFMKLLLSVSVQAEQRVDLQPIDKQTLILRSLNPDIPPCCTTPAHQQSHTQSLTVVSLQEPRLVRQDADDTDTERVEEGIESIRGALSHSFPSLT